MKIKSIKKIENTTEVFNLRIKSPDGNNHNYFANNLNVSNCHKVAAASIKSILEKCTSAEYRFGLTGTFPKPGTLDRLTIMCYSGPLINEVSTAFLQKKGYIPNCEVKIIELDYAEDDIRKAFADLYRTGSEERKKLFNLEQRYIVDNPSRLNMITNIISRSTKSSLVLFHHIDYGEKLFNQLKKNCKDKLVYYVDGSTNNDVREIYKKKMEAAGENSKMSYTILEFGNKKINILQIENVLLSDGTSKLAKDITTDDDIDDNWINSH